MRAFRVSGRGRAALVRLPRPVPAGPQVLLAVAAAGLCHSDLHVVDAPPAHLEARLPFTLGHEVAGVVAGLGPEVTGLELGQPVAVYGPWGCGRCPRCRQGLENYCLDRARLGYAGIGLAATAGWPTTSSSITNDSWPPWRDWTRSRPHPSPTPG